MRRFVILLALVLTVPGVHDAQQDDLKPTVILISFDGFRWDYQMRMPAPNLSRLAARGVHADGLIPSFPSKTFPNHYTIATGLYPGHHGIVANTMWDDQRQRSFAIADVNAVHDPAWWGGEPIWDTAERTGQHTAPFFWPGSETLIGGMRPTYFEPYDEKMSGSDRVQWVLRHLDLPASMRPTFLTLYFEDVDDAGHADGPDSPQVRAAVQRVDGYLGELLDGLQQRSLTDRVNVIAVSDHGMSNVSASRVVLVDDYISLDDVRISDINPTLGLFPKSGKEEAVYRALAHANPHLKVYRRSETPAHWHYRDHPRIPPIVGVADDGWQVMRRSSLRDILTRIVRPGGQHGYDPRSMSMRGIFIAAGPAFKRGATVPAFENVHIYDALARVLGVAPASNDGDPRVAETLLR